MKIPSYPVKGVAVEDTVKEMINYLRAITVTSFAGGKVVQTSGGTTLAVKSVAQGVTSDGSSSMTGPFTGYQSTAQNEAEEDVPAVSIAIGAIITDILTGDEITTVEGFDTPIALTADLVVWVSVAVSDFVSSEMSILSGSSFPNPTVNFTGTNMDEQVDAKIVIGCVLAGAIPTGVRGFDFTLSDTAYHFRQLTTTNLHMADSCFDGKACLYPLPY